MPDAQPSQPPQPPTATRCPICGKPAAPPLPPTPPPSSATDNAATDHADPIVYPFCSTRCRRIDLGRWLGGDYVISRPVEQRNLEEGVD